MKLKNLALLACILSHTLFAPNYEPKHNLEAHKKLHMFRYLQIAQSMHTERMLSNEQLNSIQEQFKTQKHEDAVAHFAHVLQQCKTAHEQQKHDQ